MIPKTDSVGRQRGRFLRQRISVFFMEDGEIANAFRCEHQPLRGLNATLRNNELFGLYVICLQKSTSLFQPRPFNAKAGASPGKRVRTNARMPHCATASASAFVELPATMAQTDPHRNPKPALILALRLDPARDSRKRTRCR